MEYILQLISPLGASIIAVVGVIATISTILWNNSELKKNRRALQDNFNEKIVQCDVWLNQARSLMGAVDEKAIVSRFKAVSKANMAEAKQLVAKAIHNTPTYGRCHYTLGHCCPVNFHTSTI